MTNEELGLVLAALLALLATAHVLGHLFSRWKQPRVIGEVLAGVLIGPSLLGRFPHLHRLRPSPILARARSSVLFTGWGFCC
jgi:Kef-type K+ transport system membrane component KefB